MGRRRFQVFVFLLKAFFGKRYQDRATSGVSLVNALGGIVPDYQRISLVHGTKLNTLIVVFRIFRIFKHIRQFPMADTTFGHLIHGIINGQLSRSGR